MVIISGVPIFRIFTVIHPLYAYVSDVSMATWNDLRIESVFALISGVVGLVGTILTVKPFCLKTKPRLPLITAILGMILSCK